MGSAATLLLALETATPATSAALLRGEELVAEAHAESGRPAAEVLLPLVDALLARAEVGLEAIGAFAVSIGPGSFTSLRVGVATLKGLAFGSPAPAVAVPTLAALARCAPEGPHPVVPMLDARRGEVYAAAFRPVPGEWEALLEEGVYLPEALAERLPRRCVLVGEGALICGARLRELLGPGVELLPPPEGAPRARHVGRLAAQALARGEGGDAAALVPRYLRRAEAEVVRTGLRFE
jgi:tRNA threonylcarbamoyladenosine biosynthesis protein TsaB